MQYSPSAFCCRPESPPPPPPQLPSFEIDGIKIRTTTKNAVLTEQINEKSRGRGLQGRVGRLLYTCRAENWEFHRQ